MGTVNARSMQFLIMEFMRDRRSDDCTPVLCAICAAIGSQHARAVMRQSFEGKERVMLFFEY